MTSNSAVLNGSSIFSFNVTFNFNGKSTLTTSFNGNGTITYNVNAFTYSRADLLPANATGNISIDFSTTTVAFTGFPTTDQYANDLQAWQWGNVTANFAQINTDLQTAFNAYLATKNYTNNFTIETQMPDINFTYAMNWTANASYTPNGVIYSYLGNTSVPVTPTPVIVKQSRGFLKLAEEEEMTVADVPVFNPLSGGRQISLTTQSLVFDLVNNISESGLLTFPVNNTNKGSSLFLVNADYLTRIYPGIMGQYPRDAPIEVSALVNGITYSQEDLSGVLNMTVTVTAPATPTPVTLLSWYTIANFTTAVSTSPVLNFNVATLVTDRSSVIYAPFGFVDASTLGRWIDDSFANYNPTSWSLYKFGLNFTNAVGTINTTAVAVTGATVFYAGN